MVLRWASDRGVKSGLSAGDAVRWREIIWRRLDAILTSFVNLQLVAGDPLSEHGTTVDGTG